MRMDQPIQSKGHPTLIKKLRTGGSGLKCAHININGLYNKLEEIKLLLKETDFDLLAITETHLNEEFHEDEELNIDNYDFRRNDRKTNSWGGVLFYYKTCLEIETDIESIWLDVIMNSQKYLVGAIYCPPKYKQFLQKISVILERICHRSNIFLLGDFNIDLSEDDKALTKDFKQILAAHSLTNVIMNFTRITATSKTLIDLAITANPDKLIKSGTYAMGLSDHDLIFIIIQLHRTKNPPKIISVRNYKDIDTAKIKTELETVPWHIISIFDDVDDSLWCWEYLYHSVISEHVKTRKVKVRKNNQPWMTGEVRKAINNRYKLLIKARSTPRNSKEWSDYKKARNACTNIIRSTKANYWKNEFTSCESSEFWSLVKKFKGKSKTQRIGPLKSGSTTVTNDVEKANTMNNFFANIGKELATPPEMDADGSLNSYIYRVTPTASEIQLSTELLRKSFKAAVKIGKACGPDNITAKDLYLDSESAIVGLENVVRRSLSTRKFPSKWKVSKVSAIFKKGSKSDCSNYRPISLLSIPSKIIEHLVCSQLNSHLREHNLQTEHQWGFRPQRSTEDILLYMTEKWRNAIDSGKTVAVLFIDFRKAFDTVSHPILIKKLSACGISGELLEYLQSYLSDRKQYTVLNGTKSNLVKVEFGVPQGSLIGPPKLFRQRKRYGRKC